MAHRCRSTRHSILYPICFSAHGLHGRRLVCCSSCTSVSASITNLRSGLLDKEGGIYFCLEDVILQNSFKTSGTVFIVNSRVRQERTFDVPRALCKPTRPPATPHTTRNSRRDLPAQANILRCALPHSDYNGSRSKHNDSRGTPAKHTSSG